ncbi:pentapeptide repeat-containing protein [Paraherbaspirillum soli]|uniref:Pentapeptide repeat-containing protein n=1 Tax=Paraherbaspirillum soli TaxID=631222 RepID=A0ABW0MBD5_9BURK
MFFESQQFDTRLKKPFGWSDNVFRYCDFAHINAEGGDVDSVFVSCTFEKCDWYWGIFNLAVFVQVKFTNCTFRGTAFSGSKFIECEFVDCEFTLDNLNSECSFEDVVWYGCIQKNCKGLAIQNTSNGSTWR